MTALTAHVTASDMPAALPPPPPFRSPPFRPSTAPLPRLFSFFLTCNDTCYALLFLPLTLSSEAPLASLSALTQGLELLIDGRDTRVTTIAIWRVILVVKLLSLALASAFLVEMLKIIGRHYITPKS